MKTGVFKKLCAIAAAMILAGRSGADGAPPEEVGLPVGKTAPAFTLTDQFDREVSLQTLLKKSPVVLVFYRSADWCIYCKLQILQMQRNLKQIEAAGGQVVGISFDSPDILKRFAGREKISFPLLSDAGSKTIRAYSMNPPDATGEWAGMSRHGVFILDQSGVIRAKFPVLSFQDQPAISPVVQALKAVRNPDGGTKS